MGVKWKDIPINQMTNDHVNNTYALMCRVCSSAVIWNEPYQKWDGYTVDKWRDIFEQEIRRRHEKGVYIAPGINTTNGVIEEDAM
jgi:hypothetical protein